MVNNAVGGPVLFDLDSDNNVTNNYGADGAGKVQFAASLDDGDSGLTHGGQIIWYSLSPDGQTLTGETRVGNVVGGAQAQLVFEITLQPGAQDNSYSVEMFAPVDSFVDLVFSEAAYDFVGGNETWAGFVPNDQVDGKAGDTPLNDDSKDLLLTPIGTGTAVNGNANSAGTSGTIAGQNIGQGEGMRLDFVEDLSGIPTAGDYNTLIEQTHDFDGHYEVNGVTLRFGDGTSTLTTASFKAFNFDPLVIDDDGDDGEPNPVSGAGTQVSVSSIAIIYDGEKEIVTFDPLDPDHSQLVTVGSAGGLADRSYTVTFVEISGVWHAEVTGVYDKAVTISTFAVENYSALEIMHLGPSTADADFAITGFSTAVMSTDPVFASVPIEIVDGDGDAAASTLELAFGNGLQSGTDAAETLNGTTGDNLLSGGLGNDTLNGDAGNDTLIGGAGADILTGGSGKDAFVVSTADLSGTGDDTVTDYSAAAGDTINLVSLFDSMGANAPTSAATATSMVKLYGTTLYVDADGAGSGAVFMPVLNFSSAPSTVLVAYNAGAAPITVTPSVSQPPVVLDLGDDGIEYVALDAGVIVDYGAGEVATAWIGADDGILVRDTGNGFDFVFADDAPGARTDLEGLASTYDSDGDGRLTDGDAAWSQFGVWQDSDGDGRIGAGEVSSLEDMQIAAIGLVTDGENYLAANGDVLVHGVGSFTRVNGSTGSLADVSFRTAVRTAEIGATAIAAAGMGYSTVAAAAAVVGLGEQGNAPATDAGQVGVQVASPAPQTEEASAASLPAEAQAVEQHETPAHSASTGAHEAEAGSSVAMVDLAGHDAPTPVGGAAPEAGTVSVPSLFDGGSGGSFFQAMEALLGAVAPTPGEGGAGGQHAAAAELPVVQDALAEAAGESFVDHLISQFAGADQPGGEVAGGEAAEALHAALGSMLAGLETAQFAFEPISGAHEMEAMAVAAA